MNKHISHKLKSTDNYPINIHSSNDSLSYNLSFNNINGNNNVKRVLCYNNLIGKGCHYGATCMYAHNLDDQKIDKERVDAYTILQGTFDLSHINIYDNEHLYKTFVKLSDICPKCIKNHCPGGYNCKYGTFSKKYQICLSDLRYGTCNTSYCQLQHLTHRNLMPYYIQKNKSNSIFLKSNSDNNKIDVDDVSNKASTIYDSYMTDNVDHDIFCGSSDCDETLDDIKRTIQFLNSEQEYMNRSDYENESIFID